MQLKIKSHPSQRKTEKGVVGSNGEVKVPAARTEKESKNRIRTDTKQKENATTRVDAPRKPALPRKQPKINKKFKAQLRSKLKK